MRKALSLLVFSVLVAFGVAAWGADKTLKLGVIAELTGDMPLLVPGIGAQGGDIEATVQAGRTVNGSGLLINSSRAILYAGKGEDFASAARLVAQETRDAINIHRHQM